MTEAAVTGNIEQALDGHLYFRTKLTFNLEFIGDDRPDSIQLIIVPLIYLLVEIDPCLGQDVLGSGLSDAIDISETNLTPFVLWQINTCNTSHKCLLYFSCCLNVD